MRPFRCIYVNCFNRRIFLNEVSTKLQKMNFFRQFKDHNSGKKHGNYTNDPIYFIFFFRSNCFYYSLLNLKISKFIFMRSPLWSVLVCKTPQFLAKSYRFGQLIILSQKEDTLRLLKIYIIFCHFNGAKYTFFRLQIMDYKNLSLKL